MGCGASAPAQKAPKRQVSQQKTSGIVDSGGSSLTLSQCFDLIVNNVKMIAAPSNMMPIVCLSENTFPVVTSFLHLEDSTPTEIQLPIVAGSMCAAGRVICFSQAQFILPKCLRVSETHTLITNAITWISGGQNTMTPILALGFDKQTQMMVIKSFQDLGFFMENGNFKANFNSYKAIVMPSDVDISDPEKFQKITDYVENHGGGLAVFYHHNENGAVANPINKLLLRYNLSFTYCLLNEEMESSENIQVPSSYNSVKQSNFIPLLARFKSIVQMEHVDTSSLDDLVTTLRYYIMVCDETFAEPLQDICNDAWDFLKRTGYKTDDGICPDVTHGIVVVLLLDLHTKLPHDRIKPIPEHEEFPGKTGDVELKDFTITVDLQTEAWAPTGLWLPAGKVAYVECQNPIPDIHVQIGSQHESLLTKPGPWKRWPSIVSVYPLVENSTSVVTVFGGIVYIAINSLITPISLEMTFRGFCQYPQYNVNNPEIWEQTKDNDVPWGELVTECAIFTLPKEQLKAVKDPQKVNDVFKQISEGISEYMSSTYGRPYRFVFDIDLPDEFPSCGYPFVFHLEEIDGIINSLDSPTPQLFTAVTLMTIVSIREDCFDQITETAIATVAASVIFQRLYPDFDPLQFAGVSLPTLFHELWEIQCKFDTNLIPQTLHKFQDPDYPVSDVPEDMWIAFVREMCRLGQRDFTKLLERSRPIPLNISISLQGLPPYQYVAK